MRIGVISDIHGNLPAIEAALDALQTEHEISGVVCLGDVVGIEGWPSECIQRVRETCTVTVLGNHDRGVLPQMTVQDALEQGVTELEYGFVTDQLRTEDAEWLWTRPETAQVPDHASRTARAQLVHSHPDPDVRWTEDDYVTPGMFVEMGAYTEGETLLLGHSHEQHGVNLDQFDGQSGLVVNPGSVGQPRDGVAEYAVVDTVTQEYVLGSAEFSTDEVISRLRSVDIYSRLRERERATESRPYYSK